MRAPLLVTFNFRVEKSVLFLIEYHTMSVCGEGGDGSSLVKIIHDTARR